MKSVVEKIATGDYGVDHTIAFIYRTNAQSRALEEACVQQNLPYVIFGSATSFYKRQEVKDCLCYLRFLYNGRDKEAFLRAVKTPRRGVGESAIREFAEYYHRLCENSSSLSLYEGLQRLLDDKAAENEPCPSEFMSKRSLKPLQAFAQQLERFRLIASSGTVEDLLTRIIDDVELLAHIDKNAKSTEEFEERKMNVRELQQATRKYSNEGPALSTQSGIFDQPPLGHFLDDVALITDVADSGAESREKRVTASLMTIHSSKGMEFDSVFFVGIEDGTIPTSQSIVEGTNSISFEEEKRLCYVAMTRAKSELVMSWRKEAAIFTGEGMAMVKKQRSRFLDAIAPKSSKKSDTSKQTFTVPPTTKSHRYYSSQTPSWGANPNRSYATTRSGSDTKRRTLSTHVERFKGTGSVYADRPTLSRLEANSGQNSMRKGEPLQRKKVMQKRTNRKADSHGEPAPVAARQPGPSWFFPVGSTVMHRTRGKGTVVPSGIDNMEVSVQFSNGETLCFPVTGKGSCFEVSSCSPVFDFQVPRSCPHRSSKVFNLDFPAPS